MREDKFYTTEDPRGYQVSLSERRYLRHIVEESGHTDVTPPEIIQAINAPIVIYQSSRHENTDVYFSRSSKTYPLLYVKVAVEMNEQNKSGAVKTAFLSQQIKGGIKEDGLKYVNYANSKL